MEDAIPVIREKTDEFARVFGREYPHFVEEYRLDDADIALVISGGHSVTCRAAVNRLREQGIKIGMARLLWVRPFPSDDLRAALRGDCHTHSDWSDGGSPPEEMADTARRLGHEWIALTDHSPRLTVANGLSADRLLRQLDLEEAMLSREEWDMTGGD
jgi:hypothetical protein